MAKRKTSSRKASKKAAKRKPPVKKTKKVAKKAVKKPVKRPARPAAPPLPSAKQQYLEVLKAEAPRTLKVMRAFPADKGDFQPHPRSMSAKRLMWTFAMEQGMTRAALEGTLTMPPPMAPEPATLGEVLAAYEKGVGDLVQALGRTREAKLFEKVPFPTGPGQMGEVPIIDIMWLMLMDSIHHRGQLSVYIRLAGGKVPSIYGPSADEPWM